MDWSLFLDDIRFPEDVYENSEGYLPNTIICRNVEDAIWMIRKHGLPRAISCDYDLSDVNYIIAADRDPEKKNGYDFIKWFCDWVKVNNLRLAPNFKYYIHTSNPHVAEMMIQYMEDFMESHWETADN